MTFLDIRKEFDDELEIYFARELEDSEPWYEKLEARCARHPEWPPYRKKAAVYELAAEDCVVKVFRHCPFTFAASTGQWRQGYGGGIGAWMRKNAEGQAYQEQSEAWRTLWKEFVNFNGPIDSDMDHHSIGYDHIFQLGINGLIAKAQKRLENSDEEKARSFLKSVLIGLRSLIRFAERYAEEAEAMLANESDPAVRRNLERMIESIHRCPAEPPRTFFDALNTILFTREIIMAIEGARPSTYGHVDRLTGPFLEADLAAGRITRDEARDLVYAFLAITDTKYMSRKERVEPSTTVVIGGCDAEGTPVFNDVTKMIIDGYRDMHLVNPKFLLRISPRHPQEYFDIVGEYVATGINNCAIYNDDVVIKSNVKAGKAIEDARLYVGGGCQENVLQNCEINSRATMFFNPLAVFEMGMFPERWKEFTDSEGLDLSPIYQAETFDEFYNGYMQNLNMVVAKLAWHRNQLEADAWKYNPCPLMSATLDDCIDNARDMTEGGCRYSEGAVDLAGIGTLIDSLWAVREVVFQRGEVNLERLKNILVENFENDEAFRHYLLKTVAKYGRDTDGEHQAFVAKAFKDIADASSGMPNSRGGKYLASLFAHRSNVSHGHRTGATPDGRKAGAILSKGMGPSNESMGPRIQSGEVLQSLQAIDMTDYPVISLLDLKMPVVDGPKGGIVIESVLRRFLEVGGSTVQFNVVGPEILIEAREHPESHPDLIVRVSGFSAYFAHLGDDVKDEIIERTLAEAGA